MSEINESSSEVHESTEVKETPPEDSGGEASEATQESVQKEANKAGGFDDDGDLSEDLSEDLSKDLSEDRPSDPEDAEDDGDDSESAGDESGEAGFASEAAADEANDPDGDDRPEEPSAEENRVGFDDAADDSNQEKREDDPVRDPVNEENYDDRSEDRSDDFNEDFDDDLYDGEEDPGDIEPYDEDERDESAEKPVEKSNEEPAEKSDETPENSPEDAADPNAEGDPAENSDDDSERQRRMDDIEYDDGIEDDFDDEDGEEEDPGEMEEYLEEETEKTENLDRTKEHLTEQEEKAVNEIVAPHFAEARAITQNATREIPEKAGQYETDDKGKNFTEHNEHHVEQVKEKTTEALDANVAAIREGKMERPGATGDVHFSDQMVDYKTTQAAALAHDTGMSDHGYALRFDENGNVLGVDKQNPTDFDSVRQNHSANSALNIMTHREEYKEAGFTDSQVDEMAVLTYAHSKSSSGVGDLNNSASWSVCFDRMDALKDQYNKDHPDKEITFDRTRFEGEQNRERLGSVATETLALRDGDVSRNSGPDAVSQSGETMHVEKKEEPEKQNPKNWKDETHNFEVKRGDTVLEPPVIPEGVTDQKVVEAYEKQTENVLKAKQVHIGEQNIVDNHTELKNDRLTHTITVADGNHAPLCTAEAIKDHVGEFATAKNSDMDIDVQFNSPCDSHTQDQYDAFRDYIKNAKNDDGTRKYSNVTLHYPWDPR